LRSAIIYFLWIYCTFAPSINLYVNNLAAAFLLLKFFSRRTLLTCFYAVKTKQSSLSLVTFRGSAEENCRFYTVQKWLSYPYW